MPSKDGPLFSQIEMNIIPKWNIHASDFNLKGLKLSVKNNPELLMRKDIYEYLTADAKVLLEGMPAI